ncbi:TetR family transcriptional regulator [Microbispora sp. ATCC PTA-5024]|uniref:TetR family transcriptional regulator n=1 Tax=Microbispora sp. ATCC PTA-5024 TaxID=316330 RepID=UPI0003DD76E0|nr:TetR family transcriptional regulator [Microbispora sp. ATCC PTA-5024]ETK35651.1 TetR family transcriptional regulator [Microbispora sp. ATCC PTA-5024]
MGNADRLTRQAVVEKAIALADAQGLEAVTIRRLAQELGVTPMALYWHFKNKDQLLQGVADHVLAEVTPAIDPEDPWAVRLRGMIEALVRVLRRHPPLADIFPLIEKEAVPSFVRATEAALDLLTRAGFGLSEAYFVSSYLLHGTLSLVKAEPGCPVQFTPAEAAEWRRQKRLMLEALPPDRFPCMVAFAATITEEPDVDRYYAFGVDLLMGGVEAMAANRTPSTATANSTR